MGKELTAGGKQCIRKRQNFRKDFCGGLHYPHFRLKGDGIWEEKG